MNNLAVIGAQWGDEGKAKIVDRLAGQARIVARYQGGANAGHTVVTEQGKFIFHLVPSGILHPRVTCVLGNGIVLDPQALAEELEQLSKSGISWAGRVLVSARAHVVFPYHKALDAAAESKATEPIGTTRRGIGPCYRTKAERRGILVGDLLFPDRLRKKLTAVLEWIGPQLAQPPSVNEMMELADTYRGSLAPLVADTSLFLLDQLRSKQGGILFEGAQGTMLDLDHGTYPFVTSSSTTAGGIATGLGIPPRAIGHVLGITKGYTTRVGEGWFPTEDKGELGEQIRKLGHEFGATTGRPRRCGWLDLVALRYAVRINGMDSLAITKLDVLDGFSSIPVCIAYQKGTQLLDHPPMHPEELEQCKPVFHELPGWKQPLAEKSAKSALPLEVSNFLSYVAQHVGVPVSLVSSGPSRSHLIELFDPWS